MIPLSSPDITALEVDRVNQVLRSRYLSGGPAIKEFETRLATLAGTKYAIGVSSGTAALHLILSALGIGPGDEVITTPFSFIASANCILYVGAEPVFCDISPADLNLDPALLESAITPQTKAILAVHVFGLPARMDEVLAVAGRHGLAAIEDACEAIGARYNSRPVGGLGTVGAFAFYPNKQITTGEGGAVVTNDERIARLVRSLANQGREDSGGWLHHPRLGYNYRLDELSAALGCAQLARLEEILGARATVARWYDEELASEPLLLLPSPSAERSWFVHVVRFSTARLREMVAGYLSSLGIETRPYFPAIHLQPVYRERYGYEPGAFPETERAAATCLALPFYNRIPRSTVSLVCQAVREAMTLYAS